MGTDVHLQCEFAHRTTACSMALITRPQPDLPVRLQKDIPLTKGDRSTYYTYESPIGYIDYPFADGTVAPKQFKPEVEAVL